MFRNGAFFITTASRPVISVGWHFTHIWKILTWSYHFTKKGGLNL